jgi:hypothetical protein
MWTTVLILAVALNLEPNRLGIIGLLLLRPRPIQQLLVFLCVSFLTNAVAGLIVLYLAYRGSFLQGESSSAIMQIAVGAVALIAAAFLFTNIPLPGSKRPAPEGSGGAPDGSEGVPSSGMGLVDNFTKRLGRLAHGDSMWLPAALGVGIALPSVDYVAMLLLIAASGEPPDVQVTALFTFLIVANTILLIPMLGYVVAKDRTVRVLEGLRTWVLARSRRDYAALLALAGILMVTVGFSRL